MSDNLERYGVFALIFVVLLIISISIWGHEERGVSPGAGDGGASPRSAQLLGGGGPPLDPLEGNSPAAKALAASAQREGGEARIPPFGEYVVKKDDNPSSIAKAVYGSERFAAEILAANPGLDARRMKIGSTVKLPDLRTRLTDARGSSTRPKLSPAMPGRESAAAAVRYHTVAKGESLEVIARRYYGSAAQVDRIVAANARIKDPDCIREGWRIRIP